MRHIMCNPTKLKIYRIDLQPQQLADSRYQLTLTLTFDDVEETNPPAARAVRALRAVLPPKLVAVRSMILPDVEASMVAIGCA